LARAVHDHIVKLPDGSRLGRRRRAADAKLLFALRLAGVETAKSLLLRLSLRKMSTASG
jgi:hypothetical protein